MGSIRWISVSFLLAALLICSGYGHDADAQQASPKVNKAVAENRELDRQWIEAFQQKDVDKLMSLYWKSPELVVVFPDGTVYKGWDSVRQGYQDFFSTIESVRLELTESTHLPSGDGVVGFGSAISHLKSKNAPEQQMTVRFTDFRRKQAGKWVYVHDHAHGVMPPPGPKPTDSLYKRLGGYDAIAAVADDFLARLMGDPQLSRFFQGVSADSAKRIRQLAVDQLCAATGGPCFYIGREMKASHAGLGISNRDWETMVNHLVAALDKFSVPEREKNEVLTALSSLKADIVEK